MAANLDPAIVAVVRAKPAAGPAPQPVGGSRSQADNSAAAMPYGGWWGPPAPAGSNPAVPYFNPWGSYPYGMVQAPAPDAAHPGTGWGVPGQPSLWGPPVPVMSAPMPRMAPPYQPPTFTAASPVRPRERIVTDQPYDLTRSIYELAESLRPSLEEEEAKQSVCIRVAGMIERTLRGYHPSLERFGSSANNLALPSGDVDLTLTIDEEAGEASVVVKRVAGILRKGNLVDVLPLPRARVPIVKFKDPRSGICGDICINNRLVLRNTRLIADYAQIDTRVRPLILAVKYWAKRRAVNDPYNGTLSSYAYVLMVITFLQMQEPPVLPKLQQIPPDGEAFLPTVPKIEGHNCFYYPTPGSLIGYGLANEASLGDLLKGFYEFFANKFDFSALVLSPRIGGTLLKSEKDWGQQQKRDKEVLAIEDPFILEHNLGRGVDEDTFKDIIEELRRAARMLAGGGSFAEVCEKYIHVEKPKRPQELEPQEE